MIRLMLKAQIKGYMRRDGVYVKPHDNGKAAAAPEQAKKVVYKPQPKDVPYGTHRLKDNGYLPKKVVHHPRLGETGKRVVVHKPTEQTKPETWAKSSEVATFVPNGESPAEINGLPLNSWENHPKTEFGWAFVKGTNDSIKEKPLHVPAGMRAASGVIIEEPDGRVWIISPTNSFGGYKNTFPKGGTEPGLSLQQNAIKETWEESGLQIEITGVLGDFPRTTSVARMYTAKRVGGTPIDMGWETQAVRLVPKSNLRGLMNMKADQLVLDKYLGDKKE